MYKFFISQLNSKLLFLAFLNTMTSFFHQNIHLWMDMLVTHNTHNRKEFFFWRESYSKKNKSPYIFLLLYRQPPFNIGRTESKLISLCCCCLVFSLFDFLYFLFLLLWISLFLCLPPSKYEWEKIFNMNLYDNRVYLPCAEMMKKYSSWRVTSISQLFTVYNKIKEMKILKIKKDVSDSLPFFCAFLSIDFNRRGGSAVPFAYTDFRWLSNDNFNNANIANESKYLMLVRSVGDRPIDIFDFSNFNFYHILDIDFFFPTLFSSTHILIKPYRHFLKKRRGKKWML